MRRLLKVIMLVWGLCVCMAGCESSDCLLSSESYCSISFVDGQGKSVKLLDTLTVSVNLNEYDTTYIYRSATDTVVSQSPIDSLVAKGYELSLLVEQIQGVLLNRKSGAEGVEIPLSFTSERDTFFYRYSARLADTVYVDHVNLPYFSSMDCGTVMHYRITSVSSTHHLIDSVRIVNPEVTNTLKENVTIYYTVNN